jgi:hypothetical protein
MPSCAGPGRVFFSCSRNLASCSSSCLILVSRLRRVDAAGGGGQGGVVAAGQGGGQGRRAGQPGGRAAPATREAPRAEERRASCRPAAASCLQVAWHAPARAGAGPRQGAAGARGGASGPHGRQRQGGASAGARTRRLAGPCDRPSAPAWALAPPVSWPRICASSCASACWRLATTRAPGGGEMPPAAAKMQRAPRCVLLRMAERDQRGEEEAVAPRSGVGWRWFVRSGRKRCVCVVVGAGDRELSDAGAVSGSP